MFWHHYDHCFYDAFDHCHAQQTVFEGYPNATRRRDALAIRLDCGMSSNYSRSIKIRTSIVVAAVNTFTTNIKLIDRLPTYPSYLYSFVHCEHYVELPFVRA